MVTLPGAAGWRALALVVVGWMVVGSSAAAQEPPDSTRPAADSLQRRPDSMVVDSLGRPIPVDTAAAASLGLPTSPSRSFPTADSIMQELLGRSGYRITRYASDTVTFLAPEREIYLHGSSLVDREGTTLEAQNVAYRQQDCSMLAEGSPTLFEGATVMVGDTMTYDTCIRTGVVEDAFTNFNQQGVEWYLRGGLAIDSGATRLYTGSGEITSCDLEDPHFHFAVGRMKWVTNNIMVGRPATLKIRDVPILWLPFIFQDMRQGRRSGLLTPRFGINDIVRPNQGYHRHITNIGYYVAINDYLDAQASLDWFAGTSVSLNGEVRYNWLDRFLTGGLSVSRIFESGRDGERGRRSLALRWSHQQRFDQRTSLNASVDYVSSSSVIRQNTVDPLLQTADLQSRINFSKQFDWGQLNVGGSRSQSLSDDVVRETLPTLSLTPSPISIGPDITWSPSISINNNRVLNQKVGVVELPPLGNAPQEPDTLFARDRTTTFSMGTPIRIGRWNWRNDLRITDRANNRRTVQSFPDPLDSTVSYPRVYGEDFATELDWNTGINLPMLFPGTWKLQPTVGIQNATGGAFMVKNRFTGGRWVQQGKRLSFGASLSPTLFGLWPGIGPLERIRHSFAPQISWSYAPPAQVNPEYLRAVNPTGTNLRTRSLAQHAIRIGLSQTVEGKFVSESTDDDSTAAPGPDNARKMKLLNWQTSALEYDFEQAKEPGMNGWRTASITNSFTSDLLRGFSLRVVHDLWDGPVGYDTTRFDPFLRTLSARFSITGATFVRLFQSLIGGEPLGPPGETQPEDTLTTENPLEHGRFQGPATAFRTVDRMAAPAARGQGFTATVNYDDSRTRVKDESDNPFAPPSNNRTLGLTMSFSPTTNWSLSWSTQYNFTTSEFGQHILRFDRDLHRWRATFGFTRAPNGNFAFTFFVNLLDQPEIKFNYDQQTVNR